MNTSSEFVAIPNLSTDYSTSITSLSTDIDSFQNSIDSIHQLVDSLDAVEFESTKELKTKMVIKRSLLELTDKFKDVLQCQYPSTVILTIPMEIFFSY